MAEALGPLPVILLCSQIVVHNRTDSSVREQGGYTSEY